MTFRPPRSLIPLPGNYVETGGTMSRTMLLIGTRKGCFVLESNADRRDWSLRGPYCESWPVYHAIYEPETGAIYAAAASEWLGARVWRRPPFRETGGQASGGNADRDTFFVVPLDPGHGRTMPDGKAAVWRTRDAGSSWQRLDNGLPQEDAYLGVLREGMTNDGYDEPGLYFGTSTGQVFASADEGESWTQIADYLPGISSVEVAVVE